MTVALVQTATFDLGETTESLNLESFDATLQRGEVLFDARVGVLGDVLRVTRPRYRSVGRTTTPMTWPSVSTATIARSPACSG